MSIYRGRLVEADGRIFWRAHDEDALEIRGRTDSGDWVYIRIPGDKCHELLAQIDEVLGDKPPPMEPS